MRASGTRGFGVASMSKASKRRRLQQAAVTESKEGPSNQVLMGLGLALLVVVIVVLVAGGGLGAGTPAGTPKPAATPAAAAVDAVRVRALEDAVKANPQNKAPMIELGNLYYDADRFPEAVKWYGAALELDPNNTDVRTDMATAYFYSGDVTRAIAEGRRVLEQAPTKVQALMNMGVWLANQTPPDTAGAIGYWQKVIALYPNTAESKQAQGLISTFSK